MKNEMIAALENKGFNRWTKGSMDRLYINPTSLGLELDFYKSGSVSYASLNGERISHSRGTAMKEAKCFIDITTGKCVSSYDEFVEAMELILAETEAELTADSTEVSDSAETSENTETAESTETTETVVITKKSINENLPRVTEITRNFVPVGFAGMLPEGAQTLKSVFADVDTDDRICTGISVYAYGDAMEHRHYHREEGVVDITELVEAWAFGREMSRGELVSAIQNKCKELAE